MPSPGLPPFPICSEIRHGSYFFHNFLFTLLTKKMFLIRTKLLLIHFKCQYNHFFSSSFSLIISASSSFILFLLLFEPASPLKCRILKEPSHVLHNWTILYWCNFLRLIKKTRTKVVYKNVS